MNRTNVRPLRKVLPVFAALLLGQGMLTSTTNAAPASRPTQASIKSVTLTTGDVTHVYGSGFRTFINGVMSNQDLASAVKTAGGSSALNAAMAGRVTGYDSTWFRGSRANSLSVTNALSEFSSSSFPQTAFAQMSHIPHSRLAVVFHFSATSGLGDQADVVTMSSHGTTGYGIIFRRGHYLAEIMVATQHGKVNTTGLRRLAMIEDQRIQAHG